MENEINKFLEKISQIESSGGKNTNHKTMESGIHSGDSAFGNYGLMPNTVKEMAKRERMSGGKELSPLLEMDGEQIKQYLRDKPEAEQIIARGLARKLLTRFGSPEEAAYAWNQGHNLSPEKLAKRNFQDHDYVKKFQKLSEGDRQPSSDIKLSSKSGAPLPSFANESEEIKASPSLWEQYQSKLDETVGPSEEALKDTVGGLEIDPAGLMGSINRVGGAVKKVAPMFGNLAEEVTSHGLPVVEHAKGSLAKDILGKQAVVKDFMRPEAPESILNFFKTEQALGKPLSASAEELIHNAGKAPKPTRTVSDIRAPKAPNKVEKLDIPLAERDFPVADVEGLEARRRALQILKNRY